jgi:hypothetical protein
MNTRQTIELLKRIIKPMALTLGASLSVRARAFGDDPDRAAVRILKQVRAFGERVPDVITDLLRPLQSREREVRLGSGTTGDLSGGIRRRFEMKNPRKIDILKLAIKPAIILPVASLIVGALALPALAIIPPNVSASRSLHPAESVMPHHRNFIDPTPGLAWRQYADADYLYEPHYNQQRAERLAHEQHYERAEHRWQHDERAERAGHSAERRVKERAAHLRHEWHEHVGRDYD